MTNSVFSENTLFEEYMYQIFCFYHKLTYYGLVIIVCFRRVY